MEFYSLKIKKNVFIRIIVLSWQYELKFFNNKNLKVKYDETVRKFSFNIIFDGCKSISKLKFLLFKYI